MAEVCYALENLCANLAQAAALCWAFELGDLNLWEPGCGRDAK